MQLYALDENRPCFAREAVRGKNYRCPECSAPLKVRGGLHRQLHFFHQSGSSHCRQNQKSLNHLQLQLFLCSKLSGSQMERSFPEIGRIADVAWEERKIIFEIQCSPISLKEAEERCADYGRLGYSVVWLLHDARFNRAKMSAAEVFLRGGVSYFTNFDKQGKGEIYDQFDLCRAARRRIKGPPLSIDLSRPLKKEFTNPLPFRPTWPLFFEGDLLDRLHKTKTPHLLLQQWKELEKRLLPTDEKISLWQRFLNGYRILLYFLLESLCKRT
jgi:competence protein CoiA